MRVQSIFSNNYAKNGATKTTCKNPAFEANIYSITKPTCHEGNVCELAMIELVRIFTKNALESSKILVENTAGAIMKTDKNGDVEFVLLDKSTALFKKLKNGMEELTNTEEREKLISAIRNDSETVKMPLLATEDEICPSRQLGSLLNEILGGPSNLN